MLFTSGEFPFVFLPITVLGFFVIARWLGNSAAAAWLTLASFTFYGYWLPRYSLLLGGRSQSTLEVARIIDSQSYGWSDR